MRGGAGETAARTVALLALADHGGFGALGGLHRARSRKANAQQPALRVFGDLGCDLVPKVEPADEIAHVCGLRNPSLDGDPAAEVDAEIEPLGGDDGD